MTGGGQLVGGGTKRLVVDVGQDNGSARFGEAWAVARWLPSPILVANQALSSIDAAGS